MEFHVWSVGSQNPTVFEDETLVRQYIADQNGVVIVKKYQHALLGIEVYGAAGGSPKPSRPAVAIPTVAIAINHVERFGGSIDGT
jgi:hypothetical protein